MTGYLPRRLRSSLRLLALASFATLAGCISSTAPILTDARPLLGETIRLQLYTLRDGAAHEPTTETFRWRNGRYVPINGTVKNAVREIGDFTLHAFEGSDLIVQNTRAGHRTEYAIARKLADGAYLVIAVDETDADEATRRQYCNTGADIACGVTAPDAIFALARATATKPHSAGGLAVLLAGH